MKNIELIEAFKQGNNGNCVAIAAIKAGIEVFGINNIFSHYWSEDVCEVTMRDGYELKFSKDELEIGKVSSEFVLLKNEEAFNYANLCFTAMAKRAQKEGNDNNIDMNFFEAAKTLNDGEFYLEGAHWIGLRHNVRSIGRKYIWQYGGAFGASRVHCFYVSKGYEDDYGSIHKIRTLENKYCKWFRIDPNSIH